jgi:hypothetical protein
MQFKYIDSRYETQAELVIDIGVATLYRIATDRNGIARTAI